LIHKILSKVRDMAFIGLGADASDLGIKDFPYGKSKRDLKNWKPEELKNFYTKLVSMYHEARMGKGDLGTALENVICVYCGQTMGKQGEVRNTDPATGRVSVTVVMEDVLDLSGFCQQSPNEKHANMTPEQARVQGFL